MINRNKIKSDNGVTLMVLVITIAVLLILAGVTISNVFSDEGLWDKSNEFAETANATIEENSEQVNNMINELDEIMNPWVQNKTVVTKKMKSGTKTYNVGDDYTYDCGVSGYTGKWKVLGAEKGKLLIMSTEDIGTLTLNGKEGYNTGISQLDEMCASYGTKARSITVEDINRVTGYVPEHQTISITSENKYYYDNDTTNQSSTVTGTYAAYAGTYGLATALGITNNEPVTGNAHYYYYPNTLTTIGIGTTAGIETTSPAYKLLFRNADDSANCSYWLASSCVGAFFNYSDFGLRFVHSVGTVGYYSLWVSDRGAFSGSGGVRAVVPVD